jgi:hypothetical protein
VELHEHPSAAAGVRFQKPLGQVGLTMNRLDRCNRAALGGDNDLEGDHMANKPKGRPKTDHSRPLIFQRARTRVVRKIPLSGKTAATLDRYVEWAALQADADKEETLTLTIEKALELLFKKDRLFQESIENPTETGMSVERQAASHRSPAPAPGPAEPATTRPGA